MKRNKKQKKKQNVKKQKSVFQICCQDVIFEILQYLDGSDIVKCSTLSKEWRLVTMKEAVWKNKIAQTKTITWASDSTPNPYTFKYSDEILYSLKSSSHFEIIKKVQIDFDNVLDLKTVHDVLHEKELIIKFKPEITTSYVINYPNSYKCNFECPVELIDCLPKDHNITFDILILSNVYRHCHFNPYYFEDLMNINARIIHLDLKILEKTGCNVVAYRGFIHASYIHIKGKFESEILLYEICHHMWYRSLNLNSVYIIDELEDKYLESIIDRLKILKKCRQFNWDETMFHFTKNKKEIII